MTVNRIDKEKLGVHLAALRKNRGLSQQEMAVLLGVSPRTVRRWENASAVPTMDDVINICNEFGLTVEQVFAGSLATDSEYGQQISLVASELTKTREALHDFNDGVSDLKKDLEGFRHKAHDLERDSFLNCLALLAIHMVAVIISFMLFAVSTSEHEESILVSLGYAGAVSLLSHKNRDSERFQQILLAYVIAMSGCLLISFVYLHDSGLLNPMSNMPLVLLNGPMFGFSALERGHPYSFILITLTVYVLWLVTGTMNIYRIRK